MAVDLGPAPESVKLCHPCAAFGLFTVVKKDPRRVGIIGLQLSLINVDDRFKHYKNLVTKENVKLIYINNIHECWDVVHIYDVHDSYVQSP